MSAFTCAEVRELAPELALGILSGAERAEVVLHVNGCARCQAYVAELTEAADALPQLVPEAEPPAGFEARVMRRLGDDERRTRRRWLVAVAVAAAAAIIGSVTVVRVVDAGNEAPTAAPGVTTTARQPVPVSIEMRGGDADVAAGWVYVTNRHLVAVAVDYGIPAGWYAIMVEPVDGVAGSIGTVRVENGRGSWTGRSPAPLVPGSRIALVDSTGAEVCDGTVPQAD